MRRAAPAILCLFTWAGAALAGPAVLVKGRTRVQVESVRRTDSGVRVAGRLVEAASGQGVPFADLSLRIQGQQLAVTTDGAGRFDTEFLLGKGTYELDARYGGADVYDESALAGYRFDVDKAALDLAVRAPAELEVTAEGIEVAVDARSDGGPVAVKVALAVGDADARSAPGPATVATLATGADGQGKATLRRADLGAPGPKRLVVRFPGDDAFNPAEASTSFRLTTRTSIVDFRVPAAPVRFEARIGVSGRLVDSDGRPVAGATVSLVAAGRHLGDALTGRAGELRFRIKAAELAPGPVTVAAEYRSPASWRRGTRSAPATFTVLEPQPVPIRYTIAAFVATALALLAFVLARTRPWEPLLARWRARRRPDLAEGGARARPGGDAPATGITLAKPSLVSTLRRPADFGFSGRVVDVIKGHAVAGAWVQLALPAGEVVQAVADAGGRFELPVLAPGTWRGRAGARGYVTESFYVTVPHRGELRGVRIDLLPVRERVFILYRDVAAPLLPRPEMWGIWTPREILDHVRARHPAGALGALTDFVEETYFSVRVPEEAILVDAAARARAAAAEDRPTIVDPGPPRS